MVPLYFLSSLVCFLAGQAIRNCLPKLAHRLASRDQLPRQYCMRFRSRGKTLRKLKCYGFGQPTGLA